MSKTLRGGETVERGGRPVTCGHCGGDEFLRRDGLLCTKATSFFSAEAVNPGTDCYICIRCRHIEWFVGEKQNL